MVQMSCNDGIAHASDSGMLEQSVYTIKMGVFKLRAPCFARAVGWDYVEVVVACCIVVCHVGCCGLMTRCADQVVSCMHGHLDMLMGIP